MPESLRAYIATFHRLTEQATAMGKLFYEAYPAENAALLRAFHQWHQSGASRGR